MKTAFVFPGQGSQHVGMGADLYEGFPEVRKLYAEAGEVLGYDVGALSFNGPEEELNKTENTQPCLLVAGIAAFNVLNAQGAKAVAMAGHSLGEYTALVASGAIAFADALRLTRTRGRLMQEAQPPGTGMMAAVLGMSRAELTELCKSVKDGHVGAANINCPGQIVISGHKKAVEEAMALAREAGAKRVIPLAVSVPSHSPLMQGAATNLDKYIADEGIKFALPGVTVISNVSARAFKDAEDIRRGLLGQLTGAVLWEDSIAQMISGGVEAFVELGPGKVLAGLIKRISRDVKILNVRDRASLDESLKQLGLA